MTEIELTQGTVEYLYADVTADQVLDSQPVQMAIAQSAAGATWLDAEWVDAPATSRSCRILLDGTLGAGRYSVYVRVTDSPEVPVFKAGILRVRG